LNTFFYENQVPHLFLLYYTQIGKNCSEFFFQ
jgi:hypothetical protein